jgi:hypothetical protein
MKEFDQVKLETVKFMHGNYRLIEVAEMYYGNPCVKFRQNKKPLY